MGSDADNGMGNGADNGMGNGADNGMGNDADNGMGNDADNGMENDADNGYTGQRSYVARYVRNPDVDREEELLGFPRSASQEFERGFPGFDFFRFERQGCYTLTDVDTTYLHVSHPVMQAVGPPRVVGVIPYTSMDTAVRTHKGDWYKINTNYFHDVCKRIRRRFVPNRLCTKHP